MTNYWLQSDDGDEKWDLKKILLKKKWLLSYDT